jgi:Domain of unknown function (DUF4386)
MHPTPEPVLSDANYVLGQGADTQVAVGMFLDVLLAVANIATAVVLFPILRRQSEARLCRPSDR